MKSLADLQELIRISGGWKTTPRHNMKNDIKRKQLKYNVLIFLFIYIYCFPRVDFRNPRRQRLRFSSTICPQNKQSNMCTYIQRRSLTSKLIAEARKLEQLSRKEKCPTQVTDLCLSKNSSKCNIIKRISYSNVRWIFLVCQWRREVRVWVPKSQICMAVNGKYWNFEDG